MYCQPDDDLQDIDPEDLDDLMDEIEDEIEDYVKED